MKFTVVALIGLCTAAFAAVGAFAQDTTGWRVEGSRAAPPYRLVLPNAGTGVSYIFDCSGTNLPVTETGVTELLDMSTRNNSRVPDTGESRTFPQGSAMLAVVTNPKADPKFVSGTAKLNPNKGWDITIELPKKDKSVQDLGRSDFVSLFSTGYTGVVVLNGPDKKTVSDFIKECRK